MGVCFLSLCLLLYINGGNVGLGGPTRSQSPASEGAHLNKLAVTVLFLFLLLSVFLFYSGVVWVTGWSWYWPVSALKFLAQILEECWRTLVLLLIGGLFAYGFGLREGARDRRDVFADCPCCGRPLVIVARSFPEEETSRLTLWRRKHWEDGTFLKWKPGMKLPRPDGDRVDPLECDHAAGQRAYAKGDYAAALEEWKLLAEHGDAFAQSRVGYMYYQGRGVRQDFTEALHWFRKAAEQGRFREQGRLGFMYYQGHGALQDYTEAIRWFRSAADQGDTFAQFMLGTMYQLGRGVSKDNAEALHWYLKAAEQGDEEAQHLLGVLYCDAEGGSPDFAEAVRWYRAAAEHGHAEAQFDLGAMFFTGQGVERDYVEAYKWFSIAIANPNNGDPREYEEECAAKRELAAKRMTSQQIAQAEELARNWEPRPQS
jgi:hypothetical protein